jgi:predicted RNA-binding Zn-ribbon protein involved in translation (DUF1610 family)
VQWRRKKAGSAGPWGVVDQLVMKGGRPAWATLEVPQPPSKRHRRATMELKIDSHTVDIPCPSCGKKTAQTIGRLKAQPKFTCTCGQSVTVDLAQFKKTVAAVQKRLDDLQAQLRKFGKR